MKIVIDARLYGVEHTGIGRYVLNLINELKNADKDNEYVLLLRNKYFNSLKLPLNWEKVLVDVPHYTIREQLVLPQVLYREKPDVFHAPQSNVPLFYFGKTIVTIHDLTQIAWNNKATTLPLPLYLIKLIGFKIVFKKAVKASSIIVPTKQVKKELVKYGVENKNDIHVIYEGFDKKIYGKDSDKVLAKYSLKRPYFIYVGNAYPHKNIEKAIDAVTAFNQQTKEKVQFAIVSARNNFTDKLREAIKRRKAVDFIKLLGFVPDNDLGVLLSSSKGFIYPSLAEGFGLPGVEALASGTLLLASDIPVFREVYGDSAVFFDPKNSESIVESMKYVVGLTKEKRKKLVGKGKSQASKYSWNKMAKETLEKYEDVAERNSPQAQKLK